MPRAVFLLLLAFVVPSASAATAILPLGPGDSVHATDGPANRDLSIEQIFGQSVAVLETDEPALVGFQIRHANNSLSTHVLFTQGTNLGPLEAAITDLQAEVAEAQQELHNRSLDITASSEATHQSAQQLASKLNNLTANVAALDDRAAAIQAAATESNQLVRNLEMPDLQPIQDQLDETQSKADQLGDRLTAITVLAVFTLMGVIGALLHTAWPHMRHWLPPRDAPDDHEDDLDRILQQEQAEAEALAVELVPGSEAAGLLETELRDKLTPPSEEE